MVVKIRYIERGVDRLDKVPAVSLIPLTRELAEKKIESYNDLIGGCNMRIHAFNECLRYMD